MLINKKDLKAYQWLFEDDDKEPEKKGFITQGEEGKPVPGDVPPEKQVHIFDFDDTLGLTDNANGVMLYVDGKPAHKTAAEVQAWLTSKGISQKHMIGGPKEGQPIENPSGKEGFAAYVSSAGLAKLQTTYTEDYQAYTPGEPKESKGEMLYIDFTPSSYVNPETTKPIPSVIDKLKKSNAQGSDTMVITARAAKKEEPGIDFAGKEHIPSNSEDISAFLDKQGAAPKQGVLGMKGQNKGEAIINKFFTGKSEEEKPEEIHFYDDLAKNTIQVDGKLNGAVPAETFIYGPGEFAHGGADPNKPNISRPAAKTAKTIAESFYFDLNRWQRMAGIKRR